MSILSRIFGICSTKPPADGGCWRVTGGNVEIDLSKARELDSRGGAIRLEGGGLPLRVLVMHGNDGEIYAYRNKCTHIGRRLDPLTGSPHIQCCSVNKSTWDYDGASISGPGREPLTRLPVERVDSRLIIGTSGGG